MKMFLLMGFGLLLAGCVEQSGFEEHLLKSGFSYSYGISTGDLDDDGQTDIVASDAWTPDHAEGTGLKAAAVYLFRNGPDGFTESDIARGIMGPKPHWGGPISLLERNEIEDIDGDGLPDVSVVHLTQDRVMAFRNPGAGRIGEPWPYTILARTQKPVEIAFADIDGDKKPDLITASWDGGVWWARNSGTAESWRAEPIARPDKWEDTRNLLAGDIDRDGRTDVIASDLKAGQVALFLNKPEGWRVKILASGLKMPWHGDLLDWDGDGDLDHVFGTTDGIYLLRNGPEWKLELIARAPKRNRAATWFEVKADDMDGDGDLDLVATRSPRSDNYGGEVWWFERKPSGFTPHRLKADWGKANQIRIADLNGDGKPDIVASTEQPHNEVRYWLNLGR